MKTTLLVLCLVLTTAYASILYTRDTQFSNDYEVDPSFDSINKYDDDQSEYLPLLRLNALGPKSTEATTKKPKKVKVVPLADLTAKIEALKAECNLKKETLISDYNAKVDELSAQLIVPDPTKADALADKLTLKLDSLDKKCSMKIAALQAQIDSQTTTTTTSTETDPNLEVDQFNPNLVPEEPVSTNEIEEQPSSFVPSSEDSGFPFDFNQNFGESKEDVPDHGSDFLVHPMLRLPKVKTTVAPELTTAKVPTIADAYWKAWGTKIAETFNKSKSTTEPTFESGVSTDAVDPVATTPLPPTFWMTFGKTMGKAFADAKVKIMTTVKATTPVPAIGIDDALLDGTSSTTEFVVDDTFWDEFGKTLGDALSQKAMIESLKTTTAIPTAEEDLAATNTLESLDFSHDLDSQVPTLKLGEPSAIATTPVTVPGLYWKQFGDTIKTSFNKSKTATTDTTTDDATASPVPPTFWMNFGKTIGKSLADAKFKLVSVTKPVIPAPSIVDPATAAGVPVQPIDDVFWQNFGQQLDSALQAKNAMVTPIVPVDTVQTVVTHDLPYESPKLYLSYPSEFSSVPLTQGPVTPGLYWKNYGDQISGQFMAPTPTPDFYLPPGPGLYWKNYGDQMGSQFLNAKGPFIGLASKVKPAYTPGYYSPNPFYPPMSYPFQPYQPYQQPMSYEDDQVDSDFIPSHVIANQPRLNLRMAPTDSRMNGYGANIKSQFQDAKMRTYDDVFHAKYEQPIYDVNADITTLPERQAGFWATFGTRVKDNFNNAKTRASGWAI